MIEEKGSPPILNDNTRGNGYSMHSGKGGPGGDRDAGPCRDFMNGTCKYGDRCKWSHQEGGGRDARGPLRDRANDENRGGRER